MTFFHTCLWVTEFSKQRFKVKSPLFLLYGRQPLFLHHTQNLEVQKLDNDTIKLKKFQYELAHRGAILQVMPLAMRNLAIAQEGDKNGFRLVQGGAYDRPKAKFQLGEYFLLIKNKNININKKRSLQPSVHLHILRNMEVRVPEWLYLVEMEQW